MQDEERIRQRAHAIWEREGRPAGRHEEHWAQARREIAEEGSAAVAAPAEDASNLAAAPGPVAVPAAALATADAAGAPGKAGATKAKAGAARGGAPKAGATKAGAPGRKPPRGA